MQVLYQLSYGPLDTHGRWNAGRSALARRPRLASRELTTQWARYTWRQTATSLPCTLTCSAGSTRGA